MPVCNKAIRWKNKIYTPIRTFQGISIRATPNHRILPSQKEGVPITKNDTLLHSWPRGGVPIGDSFFLILVTRRDTTTILIHIHSAIRCWRGVCLKKKSFFEATSSNRWMGHRLDVTTLMRNKSKIRVNGFQKAFFSTVDQNITIWRKIWIFNN